MADRHPSVLYINAITSMPQVSEKRCYPDEAAAFDHMCAYRPFNNTATSPQWCDLVHCPNGCVQGGTRTRPVMQEELAGGCWRCPKCHLDYQPGDTPGWTPAQIAARLSEYGLQDVTAGQYGGWPVVVTGVIPENPDTGLYVVRVAEETSRAEHTSVSGKIVEPLFLGLYEPDKRHWVAAPVEAHNGLSLAEVLDQVARWL